MGADGGTIPKRNEIVKNKAQKRQEDKNRALLDKWQTCHISDLYLRRPIVALPLGHMANKEAVLEHVIEWKEEKLSAYHLKEDKMPILDQLKRMADVKELNLKDNPAANQTATSDEGTKPAFFVCPITGLEMNGRYKFFFSWRCGCVVSERAIKEVSDQVKKCLVCQKPYMDWELVQINPETKDDLAENESVCAARVFKKVLKKEGLLSKEFLLSSVNLSDSDTASSTKSPTKKSSNKSACPESCSSSKRSSSDQLGPSCSSSSSTSKRRRS